ncbi:MAG: hypothetical protein ABS81_17420 [Pseudonocardia sp. SCN 72-86]|nr:MAG: hypothetical protein ABS81_17420 [Pseudonocardia sp. SCN 72-86]
MCGTVLADGTYRRLPPNLTLRDADGNVLQPTAPSVLLRQLGSDAAKSKYVAQNLGELVYDLTCAAGHQVLRTMPEIVARIRSAKGPSATV